MRNHTPVERIWHHSSHGRAPQERILRDPTDTKLTTSVVALRPDPTRLEERYARFLMA